MDSYTWLHALVTATKPLSADGEGGSHTDVLRFDDEQLRTNLTRCSPADELTETQEQIVERLAKRYLVKRGKIDFFSMPLLGKETNHIRRNLVSYAFGPVGYNLMPSYEKTLLDAAEAVRLIPYFAFGSPTDFFAPDFVASLAAGAQQPLPPNQDGTALRTILRGAELQHQAYGILADDEYFHAQASNAEQLTEFQTFVRRNPLIPTMEEKLSAFFEAPITVGVRDTLRWLKGSRHPRMPWETARSVIENCFERHGSDNFLLPEITYYGYDSSHSPEQVAAISSNNERVARSFAGAIHRRLSPRIAGLWERHGNERLALELLDFHHDYTVYEVEPYSGVISATMLRLALRAAHAIFVQATGLRGPEERNVDLDRISPYQQGLWSLLSDLYDGEREPLIDNLSDALVDYQRHGLVAPGSEGRGGQRLQYQPLRRTFYTFQERADVPQPGRRMVGLHTLDELWESKNAGIWQRYPELAEKLVVFFTLIYRYFLETGFLPDLRPRDAGRDIFIYGIWGYMTENLLIVEETDEADNPIVRPVFVDNRDQFKQYRRGEDRRKPLGTAKYALRFIQPVIEPAMQRSLGLFVQKARGATPVRDDDELVGPLAAADRAVDVARTVAQSSVDSTFVNAKAMVDDLVDDAHVGAKRRLGDADKKLRKLLK